MGEDRPRRSERSRGITLPELLVVVAILGLLVLASVGLVSSRLGRLEVRTAARQFYHTLSAARQIAVSRGFPTPVNVEIDPDNRYDYIDASGRNQVTQLPPRVRIVSTSTPIVFGPLGSVSAATETVFEAEVAGRTERWRVSTCVSGFPSVEEVE